VAGYDAEALIALLSEVGEDLVGTGYSRLDVDALLDSVSAEGPVEEDEIPPVPKAAVTRPGEVVELGEHRLACGDARDADLVARLMQADVADCVVTDPPYGVVAYEGKTRRRLRLVNDHVDGCPPCWVRHLALSIGGWLRALRCTCFTPRGARWRCS